MTLSVLVYAVLVAGKPRLTPEEAKRRRNERALRWYYENRERGIASALAWAKANPEKKRANDRTYHAKHRDERLAKNKQWRDANLEQHHANSKRWNSANPERKALLDRRRFEKNREAYYAYQRAYAKAHPEIGRVRVARRRALKMGAVGTFTMKEWLAKVEAFTGRCAYCLKVRVLTIDHVVPLSRGGTNWISNIVPACESCNKTKRDMTVDEFVAYRERSVLRPR